MSLDAYPMVAHWLRIEEKMLVLQTGKVDLGQRISTALARIASEELSLPYDAIRVAAAKTGESPDEGITSGSNSIEQSGLAQRLACATARDWMLQSAAQSLGCDASALEVSDGLVSLRGSNETLQVIDLLAALPGDLAVDPSATFRVLSAPIADAPPFGLQDMVRGTFTYVHDLERPNMLHARLVRPPITNAKLSDCDAAVLAHLADAGLQVVRDGSFLAVAGPVEWHVVRAAARLQNVCTWDIGDGLAQGDIFALMAGRQAQRLAVLDGVPSADDEVSDAPETSDYAARFERPYTLHGALGPSAAMAEFRDGKLVIQTHSQGIYFLRDSIADSFDMPSEDIVLEHVPGSGCYGHNAADDAAFDAALVARAIPSTPILLKYSREDEHAREPVGTAMAVSVKARMDTEGNVESIWMEARGDTHRGRPRPGQNRAGPARLAANAARDCDIPAFVPEPNLNRHAGLHRNLDPIYDIPEKHLIKALVPDLPLRPSALRCLGAPANILAIESMMDTQARAAGCDPIDYRLRHLSDPRARHVLTRLRQRLKNLGAARAGEGRGVAYAQYKNAMTRVAVAVDLTVEDTGVARLNHILLVADAGRVVDPDGLRAQLEGGALQAASWSLHERVLWGRDGRETLDWDSYPVLRFDEVPEISIELVEPADAPTVGAGEASGAPTVAAIANAIFSATGLRLTRMPFDRDAIRQAALQA